MTSWNAELSAIAHQHLPADIADKWTALLRPCARLALGAGGGQAAARLGGVPALPHDTDWPVWEGHGPLSFVASVDCAALPTGELDIPLPADGTLLFFYFDGQLDDGDALVIVDDRDSWDGARVIYVPAGTETVDHPTPEGLTPYPQVSLTAQLTASDLDPWHPVTQRTFGGPGWDPRDHPISDEAFGKAVGKTWDGPCHRIGGHPMSVQNPVEYEVAHALLGGSTSWHSPELAEEAERWLLLAQIDSDSDADMMWGDVGSLYWLIRRKDLAEKRFDQAVFTWQCG
ncbi:YwqG family protein [Kitasatospora sp. NBC_01266]|uniref:YwqG family protein n=1 Tax=Kitasatospora sp. NBC_01266 TaxID=2903572 RepID=UPI002E36AEBA|nr:YwqG family protein [Kitasatospora sp. NBC_01266]